MEVLDNGGNVSLRITGEEDCLLFCAIVGMDVFERSWGPYLLDQLKSKFGGTEAWKSELAQVLGTQAVNHIQGTDLDIYQLCTMMLKLNHRLYNPAPATTKRPREESKFDCKCVTCTSPSALNFGDDTPGGEFRALGEAKTQQPTGFTETSASQAAQEESLDRSNRNDLDCVKLHAGRRVSSKQEKLQKPYETNDIAGSCATAAVDACAFDRLLQISREEEHDVIRTLNNSILAFRNKLLHNCELPSPAETLTALLSMEELWDMYSSLPATVGQPASECREIITMAIATVRKITNAEPASPTSSTKIIAVESRCVVRFLGLKILQKLASLLLPVVDKIKGCPSSVEPENTAESSVSKMSQFQFQSSIARTDIRLIASYFTENLINVFRSKTDSRSEVNEEVQKFCRVVQRGSPEAGKFSLPLTKQIDKLLSAFNKITGKSGLRNAVCHSKSVLTESTLKKYLRSAVFIVSLLAGEEAVEEFSSLSACIGQLPARPNAVDLLVHLSPSTSLPAIYQPSLSPSHSLLQPSPPNTLGRLEDVQQIQEHLLSGRNVVLTAPAGMGKTTVAICVAASLRAAYPMQFWMSGTSEAALSLSISRLGQHVIGHCHDELRYRGHTRSFKAGLEYLRKSSGLLLVIDDVREPKVVLSSRILPAEALTGNRLLLTSLVSEKNSWQHVLNCVQYPLPPLSKSDCLQFLTTRCSKVPTYTRFLASVETWQFLADQMQGSPLLLELTARLLQQSGSIEVVKNTLTHPHAETASLTSLQSARGESRFGRCVSVTVKMLLEGVPKKAVILLVALCLLGRSTCSIPLWLFKKTSERPLITKGEVKDDLLFLFGNDKKSTDVFCSNLRALSEAGLVQNNEDCILVPLHVQKSVLEQHSYGIPGDRCVEHVHLSELQFSLEYHLLQLFRQSFQARQSRHDPRFPLEENNVSSILPLARSLVDNTSCKANVQKAELLLWLSRCTPHNKERALEYNFECSDVVSQLDDADQSFMIIPLLERGLLLRSTGDWAAGITVFQTVLAFLECCALTEIINPLDGCPTPVSRIVSWCQRELLVMCKPVFAEAAQTYCHFRSDWPLWSCNSNLTLSSPTSPMKKQSVGTVDSCAPLSGFIDMEGMEAALRLMAAGCEGEGLSQIFEIVVNSLETSDDFACVKKNLSLTAITFYFLELTVPVCQHEEDFFFFMELMGDMSSQVVGSYLRHMNASGSPSKSQVPGNEGLVEEVSGDVIETLFRKVTQVWEGFVNMIVHHMESPQAVWSCLFEEGVLQDVPLPQIFRLFVQHCSGPVDTVLRLYLDLVAWKLEPSQIQLFTERLYQKKQRTMTKMREWIFSEELIVQLENHFPANEKIRSHPVHRMFLHLVTNIYESIAYSCKFDQRVMQAIGEYMADLGKNHEPFCEVILRFEFFPGLLHRGCKFFLQDAEKACTCGGWRRLREKQAGITSAQCSTTAVNGSHATGDDIVADDSRTLLMLEWVRDVQSDLDDMDMTLSYDCILAIANEETVQSQQSLMTEVLNHVHSLNNTTGF